MANISVKKDGEKAVAAVPTREVDPFRMMKSLFGWDPFRELAPFAFEDKYAFAPAFEIKETKDGYVFKADVPGVKQDDIDVNVTGNRLTISGKRDAEKSEQNDKFYTYERTYGSFTRTFTLPDGVDPNAVHADLRDGVLSLSVPKKPEMQPKKIPIKTPAETPKA